MLLQGLFPDEEIINKALEWCGPVIISSYVDQKPKILNENIHYVFCDYPIDNNRINFFKKWQAYGCMVLQTLSTFNGLKYIKKNFENVNFVIKNRSDEFINYDNFISYYEPNSLLTIEWMLTNNKLSDHIYLFEFETMYLAFEKMYEVVILNNDSDLSFPGYGPPSTEEFFLFYFLKYNPNLWTKAVKMSNISPHLSKRNTHFQQTIRG